MYNGSQFDELAARYGYIVIYPQANRQRQLLRRLLARRPSRTTARATRPSIVSMVRYVQQRYTTDTSRVFVTGVSSGAMMTEVLLGHLPRRLRRRVGLRGRARHLLRDDVAAARHHVAGSVEQRLLGRPARPDRASSGATSPAPPTPATPAPGRACQLWHGTERRRRSAT